MDKQQLYSLTAQVIGQCLGLGLVIFILSNGKLEKHKGKILSGVILVILTIISYLCFK